MDSEQGKLFIGGISWETTEEKLKEYFGNYGDVALTSVMMDKLTGRPRGFGFVVFEDPSVIDAVLQETHVIDGKTVEAKRALSRDEQQISKARNPSGGRSYGGGGNMRTKKIFVGGLPPTLSEEEFRQYFESYGQVTDVVVMYDQQTNRPRGFGFISFDSEEAVDRVLHKTFHDLNGKQVEVKRALPKDANAGGGGRAMGGAGYQGRDSNRFMQSQNSGSGFPSYGSSGFGPSSYWYGPASNGIGYGGGYGSYGGPAGAGYGNPNVPNAGYGSGMPGGPRSGYSNQASSGYGIMGPTGQSPSGAAGYGNQGYGYGGGYGGTDGSYGNPPAYGAVGGRLGSAQNSNPSAGGELQSSGGGYTVGSYGDASGNPGYGNQGW